MILIDNRRDCMTVFERAMINELEYFKTNDFNINFKDENGKSLLHFAVLGNAYEVIEELIRRGIDVNLVDNFGESAFFDAARKAKLQIAKLLIINKANLNLANNLGERPIHLAASKGDRRFIDLLIEAKASLDAKTNDNLYPVHYAILNGQIDVIKHLLNNSNQSFLMLDENNNNLLHYAAKTSNDLLIYFLISEGINPNQLNSNFESPLFNAVRFGTKETVNALLNNDSYIGIKNKNRETPIDFAVIYEKYPVETLLTNYQMLPKYERLIKKHALIIATINRDYTNLEILAKSSNNIIFDKYNYTALDYAKLYNLDKAIQILKKVKSL